MSTHSEALLADPGIDGREVLVLSPAKEGTVVDVAADLEDVRPLLQAGVSVGDAVLRRTAPEHADRLSRL